MTDTDATVLVIDDEQQLVTLISYALRGAGFAVEGAHNAADALRLVQEQHFDLIILDVLLPDANGHELCRRLRRHTSVPVIFLTVQADQSDVIAGLEAGGDDYLAKPFNVEELILRINAILRRSSQRSDVVQVGLLTIDLECHEARVAGDPVDLTPLEFKFLHYLAVNEPRVIPPTELVTEVWGVPDLGGHDTLVKSTVYRLRQKIGADEGVEIEIKNIRGIGYQLRSSTE